LKLVFTDMTIPSFVIDPIGSLQIGRVEYSRGLPNTHGNRNRPRLSPGHGQGQVSEIRNGRLFGRKPKGQHNIEEITGHV